MNFNFSWKVIALCILFQFAVLPAYEILPWHIPRISTHSDFQSNSIPPSNEISNHCLLEFPCNQHFLSFRRNQGQSLGSKLSYTTIETLSFPGRYQHIWPFLNFRAHGFDNINEYAANMGLGMRWKPKCLNQIFGINAYYDYRKVRCTSFNQLGLGFEILGEVWSFRLNGYLPVGKTNALCSCCFFDEYVGDYFFLTERFTESLKGVDFEVESSLWQTCWGEIDLAIGGYYYNGKGCQRNIYGSEFRVSADFFCYYNFTILATHDNVFHTRVQAQLSFTLPFSFENIACGSYGEISEDPRFFLPVEREEIIILKKRNRYTWNF